MKVDPEISRVCDFDWLVDKPHMDIHVVDGDHVPAQLQEADCILMSKSVTNRERVSYQESLRCNEAAEWRAACKLERRALIE